MNTTMNTYNIPATNYPALVEAIEKLNRRAPKLGCEPIVINVLRQYEVEKKSERTGLKYRQTWMEIEVVGEAPKLAGWTLLAVIEMLETGENLVRTVPGQTVPRVVPHHGHPLRPLQQRASTQGSLRPRS